MLLTFVTGDEITGPLLALALAQFPSYGLLLGVASFLLGKPALWITLTAIAIAHLSVAAVSMFFRAAPEFLLVTLQKTRRDSHEEPDRGSTCLPIQFLKLISSKCMIQPHVR
jgi:hypothetical protein